MLPATADYMLLLTTAAGSLTDVDAAMLIPIALIIAVILLLVASALEIIAVVTLFMLLWC